jgi:hypothetical protein
MMLLLAACFAVVLLVGVATGTNVLLPAGGAHLVSMSVGLMVLTLMSVKSTTLETVVVIMSVRTIAALAFAGLLNLLFAEFRTLEFWLSLAVSHLCLLCFETWLQYVDLNAARCPQSAGA